MKTFYKIFILSFVLLGPSLQAQVANDTATQNAIIQSLPTGVAAANAKVDEIALAAQTVAFNMEGDLAKNVTQVIISLGELHQAKVFSQASLENESPTIKFYNSMVNMASLGYEGLTTQDITPLSNAMINGMNYLNGADSLSTAN